MKNKYTVDHFMKIFAKIEDRNGYDFPHAWKLETARVCLHLVNMNPRQGVIDRKWSVAKVRTYLTDKIFSFEDALRG